MTSSETAEVLVDKLVQRLHAYGETALETCDGIITLWGASLQLVGGEVPDSVSYRYNGRRWDLEIYGHEMFRETRAFANAIKSEAEMLNAGHCADALKPYAETRNARTRELFNHGMRLHLYALGDDVEMRGIVAELNRVGLRYPDRRDAQHYPVSLVALDDRVQDLYRRYREVEIEVHTELQNFGGHVARIRRSKLDVGFQH